MTAMNEPRGRLTGDVEHLDVDGVLLAVRFWGDPSGRPVLFWHPLGDVTSGAYLTELAPTMTEQFGLRLAALDGPGFGGSPALPPEQYAVSRLAELAWGVAAASGMQRPVLMGHSWGGVVMTCAAAARPLDVSALVLLDSGHFDYADRPGAHPDWSLEARAVAIAEGQPPYADRADLLRQLQDDARRPLTDAYVAGLEPALRETASGAIEPVVAPLTRAAAQDGLLGERSLRRWPALAAADVPVLLLLATEPEQTRTANGEGARTVRALHPRSDIRALPGWGHDLIADGGPALAELIGDWLTGRKAGQPADRNVLR
jgi:pimeloyl-ACP methyl ester carboxylesterase